MDLSSDRLVLGSSASSSVKISYGSGSGDYVVWDGLNDAGAQVAGGVYVVKMTQKGGDGAIKHFSRSVTVIAIKDEAFHRAIPWPNPLGGSDVSMKIDFEGAQPGGRAEGTIYDISGKKIAELRGGDALAGLVWDLAPNLAGGIYLARVSVRNAQGRVTAQSVKIAVLR